MLAYPGGAAGYTLKNGTGGCNTSNCHGAALSSSVSVVIAGPASLNVGQTSNYTVTITGGSGTAVGVDIAASSGALAVYDGNLKLSNSELVHPSKKTFSSSKYTFTFKYTAPNSAGNITLYATGCSKMSQWNHGQNFTVTVTQGADVRLEDVDVPAEFALLQNYPNPFNPSTKIKYAIPLAQRVSLRVYDVLGNVVAVLADGERQAGIYEAEFNAQNLPGGIYFYKLKTDEFESTKKFVLLK
jgi:hypothetical protein